MSKCGNSTMKLQEHHTKLSVWAPQSNDRHPTTSQLKNVSESQLDVSWIPIHQNKEKGSGKSNSLLQPLTCSNMDYKLGGMYPIVLIFMVFIYKVTALGHKTLFHCLWVTFSPSLHSFPWCHCSHCLLTQFFFTSGLSVHHHSMQSRLLFLSYKILILKFWFSSVSLKNPSDWPLP